MSWSIKTFESKRGEKPIDNFIKSLQSETISKVAHHINLLEEHGHLLGMPHSKKLATGLYELRTRGKQEIRILYTFRSKTIYLLHAFKKQTQKTPIKEINIALNRILEID